MHATIQAKQPTAVHNNQRNYNYSIYPVNATIGPCKSHIPQTTDAAMRCYQVRVLLMMARHLLVPDTCHPLLQGEVVPNLTAAEATTGQGQVTVMHHK